MLQDIHLAAYGCFGKGKSRSVALLLLEDIARRPATAPIRVWAEMVWMAFTLQKYSRNTPSVGELSRLWHAVEAGGWPRGWGQVRGPLGALHLSMARVGWSARGPFEFTDHAGIDHQFADHSPKMIEHMCKQGWLHRLRAAASRRHGLQHPMDLHHAGQLLREHLLTPREKGCMVNFIVQGIWTKTRAKQAHYQVDDELCHLCREAPDTVEHRMFKCKAVAQVRAVTLDPFNFGNSRTTRPSALPHRVGRRTRPRGHPLRWMWAAPGGRSRRTPTSARATSSWTAAAPRLGTRGSVGRAGRS